MGQLSFRMLAADYGADICHSEETIDKVKPLTDRLEAQMSHSQMAEMTLADTENTGKTCLHFVDRAGFGFELLVEALHLPS